MSIVDGGQRRIWALQPAEANQGTVRVPYTELSNIMPSKDAVMNKLVEFRNSLDNVDSALVSILAERFKITDEVGVFKKENDIPPIDTERERRQFERIRELATIHGLEPEIAEKVLRLIIDQVVERHQLIRSNSAHLQA